MSGKVKNILIKLELEGRGVVNYDSNDQKHMVRQTDMSGAYTYHNNVMFAKKSFTRKGEVDDKGREKLDYRLKLSNNFLSNAVFSKNQIEANTAIAHHDMLLYMNIASIPSILRGYLWTDHAFKKNSVLTLTDAIQTNEAQSSIDVFTKSGVKETKESESDIGDTSLYFKETVGDITYESIGNIDLKNLQFISCDNLFDRMAFNSDMFETYKKFLSKQLPNSDDMSLGYYMLDNTIVNIPELGILFNEEQIQFMIKHLLRDIVGIGVYKKGGYVKTGNLKIKLVKDPLIDTFNNEDGWITIENEDDIQNLNFEIDYAYSLVDEEELVEIRKEFEEELKKARELKKKNSKKSNKK